MIVAIDGPVASGKSTAAKNLARALGFRHLDTGMIYRAVTVLAARSGVDAADRGGVAGMLARADIRIDTERAFVDGRDVTEEIALPEITRNVKPFAGNPDVREFVNTLARATAEGANIVVAGRDMATVVFPNADVKIFLTASPEERARRRWEELCARGADEDYETVLADLRRRDRADITRPVAPLKKHKDAVEVNSTGWTSDETLCWLEEIVRAKMQGE
ncbi:MAG: (d)CMP kinase [Planctomycetes bacterium]|nr:(d)CMP kinase [Planctomycetota bacterium]